MKDAKPEFLNPETFNHFVTDLSKIVMAEQESLKLLPIPLDLYSNIITANTYWCDYPEKFPKSALERFKFNMDILITARLRKIFFLFSIPNEDTHLSEPEKNLSKLTSKVFSKWVKLRLAES